MPPLSYLVTTVLSVLSFPSLSNSQQIGSFFTAIYLNGAPIASYQSSCGSMGQSQYCCGTGQSCAWDDSGKVACCPSGSSCQGSPYGSGATVGAVYTAIVYPGAQPQTTTDCGCETPVVSSVATVAPPSMTTVTSYYAVPTSTFLPASSQGSTTTTTVQEPGQGGFVTTFVSQGGGGGGAVIPSTKGDIACTSVSTITEVDVGQPVRTVGCLIVINGGSRDVEGVCVTMLFGVFGVVGALLL